MEQEALSQIAEESTVIENYQTFSENLGTRKITDWLQQVLCEQNRIIKIGLEIYFISLLKSLTCAYLFFIYERNSILSFNKSRINFNF